MLTTRGVHCSERIIKIKCMGRAGSGPESHVNFESGRVGLLFLWVELGRVKKIGRTSNSGRYWCLFSYFNKDLVEQRICLTSER